MKFFEEASVLPPGAERDYSQSFSRSDARYIYWELSLVQSTPHQQQTLDINAVYTRSGGSQYIIQTYSSTILANAANTTHIKGSGFASTGQWPVDSYRVDLSVAGVLVASETFQVTV